MKSTLTWLLAAAWIAGPGPAAAQQEREIPQGMLHERTFPSPSSGYDRPAIVYTPPGYEASPDALYPLFVLCHGRGDDEKSWTTKGNANRIFDRLIAEGKAVPAVVLMMNGHPAAEAPDGTDFRAFALAAFQRELLDEAIPWVEREFRVMDGAANRALAGLSMGGYQSVATAFAHPDKFAWVGSFSGAHPPDATRYEPFLADPAALNRSLRLLWFGCGTDDAILARTTGHLALLNERKVKHEWHLTDGDHTWDVWQRYLADFTPRLFRS